MSASNLPNIFDAYQEVFADPDSDAELEEDEELDGELDGDIGELLGRLMCGERRGDRDAQASTSVSGSNQPDKSVWQMGDPPEPDLTFTGQSGLGVDVGDNPSPEDFLNLLLPADFYQQLSDQTNL